MLIRIGLENGYQGRSLAWALDYPGCFAHGSDGPSALMGIPRALLNYRDWTELHAGREYIEVGDFDLRLIETWEVYKINRQFEPVAEGYEVNAWFRDDWRPLSEEEAQRGIELLTWSRADLMQITRDLPDDILDRQLPDERWSIRGVLGHVGGAEWWYLDRLKLGGERAELPKDAFERLNVVRTRLLRCLPDLVGSKIVAGIDGEFWSPRKLLRRAIWHEMDHIGHIAHLI